MDRRKFKSQKLIYVLLWIHPNILCHKKIDAPNEIETKSHICQEYNLTRDMQMIKILMSMRQD